MVLNETESTMLPLNHDHDENNSNNDSKEATSSSSIASSSHENIRFLIEDDNNQLADNKRKYNLRSKGVGGGGGVIGGSTSNVALLKPAKTTSSSSSLKQSSSATSLSTIIPQQNPRPKSKTAIVPAVRTTRASRLRSNLADKNDFKQPPSRTRLKSSSSSTDKVADQNEIKRSSSRTRIQPSSSSTDKLGDQNEIKRSSSRTRTQPSSSSTDKVADQNEIKRSSSRTRIQPSSSSTDNDIKQSSSRTRIQPSSSTTEKVAPSKLKSSSKPTSKILGNTNKTESVIKKTESVNKIESVFKKPELVIKKPESVINKPQSVRISTSSKRLVPSIAVSVKQTLNDDDVFVPPDKQQDPDNLFSDLTITASSSSVATTVKESKSPSTSLIKDTTAAEEKDKSSKRKSNLNRALHEEATKDDDHRNSVDENKNETNVPAPNNIISILKKKDSNDSGSSSNISPVTFSSSVQDTPTRCKSGILKKRSSLDESRYSRSQSPDERGILVRSHRRNSLEELHHGILKQSSYECKSDTTTTPQSEPHSILKKKDTPTGIETQSKHVSIAEAALLTTAKLLNNPDFMENFTGSDMRPILKSENSTQENTPRPILKKTYSSETEHNRPILKTSRKSSREEISSTDTEDNTNIRSILKTESPVKRLNNFIAAVANGENSKNYNRRRSRSLGGHEFPPPTTSPINITENPVNEIPLPPTSPINITEKPVVTVAERIRNMEKILDAVPKVRSGGKSSMKRFNTQPITVNDWSSILLKTASSPSPSSEKSNFSNFHNCRKNMDKSVRHNDEGTSSSSSSDENNVKDIKNGASSSSVINEAVILEKDDDKTNSSNKLLDQISSGRGDEDSSKWRFSQKFRFFSQLTNAMVVPREHTNGSSHKLQRSKTIQNDSNTTTERHNCKNIDNELENDFQSICRIRTSSVLNRLKKDDVVMKKNNTVITSVIKEIDIDENNSIENNSDDNNNDSGKENIFETSSFNEQNIKSSTLLQNRRKKLISTNGSLTLSTESTQSKGHTIMSFETIDLIGDTTQSESSSPEIMSESKHKIYTKNVMLESRKKLLQKLHQGSVEANHSKSSSSRTLQRSKKITPSDDTKSKSHPFKGIKLIKDFDELFMDDAIEEIYKMNFKVVDNFEELLDDPDLDLSNAGKEFEKIDNGIIKSEEHASTSEGESSGGREISAIIKSSAVRNKKYNDG